ncbi:hypothetical protein Trydic_g8641 [Trypoxylus dichotomus]
MKNLPAADDMASPVKKSVQRTGVLATTKPIRCCGISTWKSATGMEFLPKNKRKWTSREGAAPTVNLRSGANNAKPPGLCFVSRMKGRFHEFKRMLNTNAVNYYVQFASDNRLVCLKKMEDYMYTPRTEKTLAFLIKGLHHECECDEIKNELKELNISVRIVVSFNNTKYPIFMFTVPKSVTLKHLQSQE